MQLQFISISLPVPQKIKNLYESAFPLHERRTWQNQELLLQQGKTTLTALQINKNFAGFVFSWPLHAYTFIEYFAIDPSLRGQGAGSMVMQQLADLHPSIVLETEPAEKGRDAARRIAFYERLGYTTFPYAYQQPPYAPGYPALPMCLMHNKPDVTEAAFKKLSTEIYSTVYGLNN